MKAQKRENGRNQPVNTKTAKTRKRRKRRKPENAKTAKTAKTRKREIGENPKTAKTRKPENGESRKAVFASSNMLQSIKLAIKDAPNKNYWDSIGLPLVLCSQPSRLHTHVPQDVRRKADGSYASYTNRSLL